MVVISMAFSRPTVGLPHYNLNFILNMKLILHINIYIYIDTQLPKV